MSDSAVFKSFTEVLKSQVTVVRKLIKLERDFSVIASDDEPKKLDSLVKEAQPDLLNFRGLEKKRVRLATELGWKGLKFSEILSQVSDEEKAVLAPVFEELKESLNSLKEAQETADRIMKLRLLDVQTVLASHPVPKIFQDTLA
ncbi:flagellar export chaperone FlgN [Oribacterium sp. WCC10]|uniref:flagellar export chaperone FlgN n=1 Tax=Oribacterium sp. WCC10 TaxID=1855343 RepID=UPI0008E9F73E|nr:flagellar export chaperone FlgN [Oribacterium sp. WCC10]SFG24525.1 FlgN protein [Oribacterium sp. WCC10]